MRQPTPLDRLVPERARLLVLKPPTVELVLERQERLSILDVSFHLVAAGMGRASGWSLSELKERGRPLGRERAAMQPALP
jgi:hypothetical protein